MPNVDEPGALAMYVPDSIMFNYTDATFLVVHKTAGFTTAQDCAAYFQAGSNGENVSAHYIVGQDGTIVQCVPEAKGAGGNCCTIGNYASYLPYCDGTNNNMNLHSISVEHIDPATDNSTPLTDAQKAASFRLIKHICERHNIPMHGGAADGGIIGHNNIDTINRARCPGNYPWSELWNYLSTPAQPVQEESMYSNLKIADVKGYFTEVNSATWKCDKTGQTVGGAILKYYTTHFGPVMHGLPLTGEIKPFANDPNPNKAQIAVQWFERTVIAFDPDSMLDKTWKFSDDPEKRCYTAHIDRGIGQQLAAQAIVTPLQNQVKQLQQQLATTEQKDLAQTAQLQQQITALQSQIQQLQTELAAASGDKYLTAFQQIAAILAPLEVK